MKQLPTMINDQDIAAANVGFMLVQAVLDILIEKNISKREDILSLVREIEKFYATPGGHPLRQSVKKAAASALGGIAMKYEKPAGGKN